MAHLSSSVFTSVGCLNNCSHHVEFSEGEVSLCQQVESGADTPPLKAF